MNDETVPRIALNPPRGFRDALLAPLLRAVLRFGVKPAFAVDVPFERQRARLNRFDRLARLPKGVTPEAASVGGVAGEWLRPAQPPVKRGVVLYLHGGAFCVGAPATHRALTARLARDCGLPVFVPDYRLAPEHPFPAALDDALAVYAALADEGPVLLAGDSAGGALALLLAQALRDRGLPMPAALLLLSPLADLTLAGVPESIDGETLLSLPWMRRCVDAFRGALAADDPRLSPLHADLSALPPTLVQWGSDELLASACETLLRRLREAGVDATGDLTHGRWHVFPLHAGTLPSADAAVGRIARFALPHLERAAPPSTSHHEVIVLGAGMSGLCALRALKVAGVHDVVVIEKQQGLGGTWWDNRYPGAQVDVPSPAYAFSFAPNPDWPQRFANAADILAYQETLAAREGLLGHLRLGSALVEARFDEADGLWHFRTAKGDQLTARFFICSTGPLNQPRWPDLPGLSDFRGLRLHSARWDDAAALDGLRIGVIGTGSTAVQLIPPLSKRASTLAVFQRTPNWVLPRLERRYRAIDRALARLPGVATLVRYGWAGFLEWTRRGFDEGTLSRRFMLALAGWHRRRQVPDAALSAALEPPYPLGCKRIIYANDYYPTLSQPHVALVTAGIVEATANGLRTDDGQLHALDVLVCATGFDTVQLLSSITISGRGGTTLADAWRDGPRAFHGISVAGFPNLFLMLGPNTATGHTSTLFYIEAAARHAVAGITGVHARDGRTLEVRATVMDDYDARMQQRLQGSVWTQCRSWYRMANGRVIAIFPGFTPEYVRTAGRLDPADYEWT